jgi:hypothetical protein
MGYDFFVIDLNGLYSLKSKNKLNTTCFITTGLLLLVFSALQPIPVHAQKARIWSLNGYASGLQTAMFQDPSKAIFLENTLHNRLNFRINPSKHVGFTTEVRTRLITGQFFSFLPDYADLIAADNGLVNLSHNLLAGNSFALNTSVDRLYMELTLKKTDITLGRQRINWGQCFAWNPNDIFNAYSFFDFDYEEKPGSDAVRIQYYPGALSTLEFAFKADRNGKLTAAAFYRFNKWKYDFQFLGGVSEGNSIVAGAGWAGNISGAGFRGEASYFHPAEKISDTSGILVAAIGAEYIFKNSFFLQAEALYNMNADKENSFMFAHISDDISVRKLSFTEYSLLLNASFPLSPIWNVSLAAMYFPRNNGFFAGPSISHSVSENASVTVSSQTFGGTFTSATMEYYTLIYLRLKINF